MLVEGGGLINLQRRADDITIQFMQPSSSPDMQDPTLKEEVIIPSNLMEAFIGDCARRTGDEMVIWRTETCMLIRSRVNMLLPTPDSPYVTFQFVSTKPDGTLSELTMPWQHRLLALTFMSSIIHSLRLST